MYVFPDPSELRDHVAPFARRLTDAERAALEDVLRWDVLSEFDARFLSAHLRRLDLELSEAFLAYERIWARDEERHYRLFRAAYDAVQGFDASFLAELETRTADFEPIAHLLEDEFAIACLGAYDELATVRAFRTNLPHYDRLGPVMSKVVRHVIADEARHYHGFLTVIREQHADRIDEAPEVLRRIRETEGTAYGNTFVLDHDDPIFTDAIYDRAQAVLLKHIARTPCVARR